MMFDPAAFRTILLEEANGWLTIWLNRPALRNALSGEMVDELLELVGTLRDDRSVRGVTFRGKGEAFCSGGDIGDFRRMLENAPTTAQVAEISRRAGLLFHGVNALPQVTVMLVHGAAMAGGLGLACAGDVVIAAAGTAFALTETQIGIPPAQIAPLVVQRTGLAAARRLMLTGVRFDAAEAVRLGIADHLAEDAAGLERIEAGIRTAVLRSAPRALAATKEILLAAPVLEPEAMADFAAWRFAECILGDEGREGISAFIEKRLPNWSS